MSGNNININKGKSPKPCTPRRVAALVENQENAITPSPAGKASLKMAELGLNSPIPRSPLASVNSNSRALTPAKLSEAKMMVKEGMGAAVTGMSPKGFIKRKVLSARVVGSNKTPRGGKGQTSGAREDSGYLSRSSSFQFGQGDEETIAPQWDMGGGPDFPLTLAGVDELLCKPILRKTFSPIKEEEGENGSTPKASIKTDAFKRPSTIPLEETLRTNKRPRCTLHGESHSSSVIEIKTAVASMITKSVSETNFFKFEDESDHARHIMKAVERIDGDPTLVGDGSRGHVLPIMAKGKHSDLKEIEPSTLVSLLQRDYDGVIQKFEIVDCRYPYEYEGGHIGGAVNVFTRPEAYQRFFGALQPLQSTKGEKRHILIFHCEFSSQRAPEMCRYVRDCDRKMNPYPLLHYPELYVLFGGYKLFFERFKAFCTPPEYLPMSHEKYAEEYRHFKNMSKTDLKKRSSKVEPKKKSGIFCNASSTKKLNLDDI